ncbi:MAG: D-aminoacylase [Candidatus Hydrogenedentota bacterium]
MKDEEIHPSSFIPHRYKSWRLRGRILDGSGAPEFPGVITIHGDAIESVTTQQDDHGDVDLDLPSDLVITPGFIDIHSHGDHFLLVDPSAASKLMQGVTTDVIGNCGYSAAPLSPAMRERRTRGLSRYGLVPRWSSFEDYLRRVEDAQPAVNVAALAGHGTLRTFAGIPEDRAASQSERLRLAREAARALKAGAFGITTGLVYAPGKFADQAELSEMLRPVSERNALYAAHLRDEGDLVVEALQEALDLVRTARVRFQYSHIKTWGRANWKKRPRLLQLLRAARAEGLDIATDLYPYTSAATELLAGLGLSGERDPEVIRKRVAEMAAKDSSWSKRIRFLTAREGELSGRRLSHWKKPAEFLVGILEKDPHISAAFTEMSEANVVAFMKEPYSAIGSDASNRNVTGPFANEKPHPRAFGTFPRFLARYVRDKHILSLPEAVRKVTLLPASRLGLTDRGLIRSGRKADIVVFHPGRIEDRSDFRNPQVFPTGMEHVWVNGRPSVRHGELTADRSGRVLRAG